MWLEHTLVQPLPAAEGQIPCKGLKPTVKLVTTLVGAGAPQKGKFPVRD